jgi:hypothetical protein
VYINSTHRRKAENKTSFLFMNLGMKAKNKVETMIDAWSRKSRGVFLSLKRRK